MLAFIANADAEFVGELSRNFQKPIEEPFDTFCCPVFPTLRLGMFPVSFRRATEASEEDTLASERNARESLGAEFEFLSEVCGLSSAISAVKGFCSAGNQNDSEG
jgi:hypothetical protein